MTFHWSEKLVLGSLIFILLGDYPENALPTFTAWLFARCLP